jgi:hypothetical protein
MVDKIIPGIRKLGNGECARSDNGKPPMALPDGETINKKPPPTALAPKNSSKPTRIFLAVVGFTMGWLRADS